MDYHKNESFNDRYLVLVVSNVCSPFLPYSSNSVYVHCFPFCVAFQIQFKLPLVKLIIVTDLFDHDNTNSISSPKYDHINSIMHHIQLTCSYYDSRVTFKASANRCLVYTREAMFSFIGSEEWRPELVRIINSIFHLYLIIYIESTRRSSVSRPLKTFSEPNRPADWFSTKNCALQYQDLLEKIESEMPK